jgi:hypothetical protein
MEHPLNKEHMEHLLNKEQMEQQRRREILVLEVNQLLDEGKDDEKIILDLERNVSLMLVLMLSLF